MTFKESVEWTRGHIEKLNIGGVWAIPYSGLVLARKNEKEVCLIDAIPFDAIDTSDENAPKDRAQLIEWQTASFREISERLAAAGYLVTSEVADIQPISFDLSK